MQEGETHVQPSGLHELERQLGRPEHLKCSESCTKEESAARRGNSLGAQRLVHRSVRKVPEAKERSTRKG